MKVSDQPHFGNCIPVKEPPVPVKWETEWSPDLAWTLLGKKNVSCQCWKSNCGSLVVHRVA